MKSHIYRFLGLFSLLFIYSDYALATDPLKPLDEDLNRFGDSDEIHAFDVESKQNFIIKPRLYQSNITNKNYSYYLYYVNNDFGSLIRQPYKVKSFQFNGVNLLFDDQARLPQYTNWSLFAIYASKSNIPVLIRIHGTYGYTFYSLNKESGKWKNHRLINMTAYERIDEFGVAYYKYDDTNSFKDFYEKLSKECGDLSMKLSKENNDTDVKPEPYPPFVLELVNPEYSKKSELNNESQDKPTEPKPQAKSKSYYYTPLNKDKQIVRIGNDLTIKPRFGYYNKKSEEVSAFTYYLEDAYNFKSKNLNAIDKVFFNGNPLEFYYSASLPNQKELTVFTVITCEHNVPVLIRIHGNDGYFLYSPHPKYKKWTNYSNNTLGVYEKIDENGVIYYNYDMTSKSDFDVFTFFYKLSRVSLALSKKLCKGHKSVQKIGETGPAFEWKIKVIEVPEESKPKVVQNEPKKPENSEVKKWTEILISKKNELVVNGDRAIFTPAHFYYYTINHKFTLFRYYVDQKYRSNLKFPNELKEVRFNGNLLVFDDKAKMPCINTWSVDIITCEHDIPIVINLKSLVENYYYALDPETGKWVNKMVTRLKNSEFLDDNNVPYYKYSKTDDFEMFNDRLLNEIVNSQSNPCKNHKFSKGSTREPRLEMAIRQIKFESIGDIIKSESKVVPSEPVNVPEPYIPKADTNMLIKGQLYYTATALKQKMINHFVFLLAALNVESVKGMRLLFVEEKHHQFHEIMTKLNGSFAEFNNQTEKDGWIDVLPKLSSNFSDLKELIDELYDVVYESFPADQADTLAYLFLIEKSNNLLYLLNNLDFILENVEKDLSNKKVGSNLQEFYNAKLNLENLIGQLLEEQDAEKREEHFKSMLPEASNASRAFKKIIKIVMDKKENVGIKGYFRVNSKVGAFVKEITTVSRSLIPGLFAMLLSGLVFLLI